MAITRFISCVKKRGQHFPPHDQIESVGGKYLEQPWILPDYLVIHYLKKKIERYFVTVNGKRVKVIVAKYGSKEYLKTEDDGYSPETLLALPDCKDDWDFKTL